MLNVYDENEKQKRYRYELAERLHLFPDFKMTYFIRETIRNETDFIREVVEAARIIRLHSCVTVERSFWIEDAQLVIGGGQGNDAEANRQDCGGKSGQRISYASFQTESQDRWDVLRTFLLCLAPFKDEYLRRDRDEHVYILWDRIRDGQESWFFKTDDYPPNLAGFPTYTHGCVVNRPLNYLSKDDKPTILPKNSSDTHLYRYIRWPVDLQRLRLFYRQILFPYYDHLTNMTYWRAAKGCDRDLQEMWDPDVVDLRMTKKNETDVGKMYYRFQ